MTAKDMIQSLLQSVRKIGDTELKAEILGKLNSFEDNLGAANEYMAGGGQTARCPRHVYDPPV